MRGLRRFTPLLTLFAVAVLGIVLITVTSLNDPANRVRGTAAAAPAPSSAPGPAIAATGSPPTSAAAPPTVHQKAYAGRSSGNEVTVAIAVKDGRAVAYVCDGKQVEAWLDGPVTGTEVSLTSKKGATLTATVDDAKALGTIAVGGRQWPFAAKAVVAPAGLYEGRADVRGVARRIGWIVLPDGSQTGLVDDGSAAPALDPAQPGSVVLEGAPVTVASVTP